MASTFGFSAGGASQAPPTPFRTTEVIFDQDDPVLIEPAFGLERTADELSRVKANNSANAVLIPGLGITIKPYFEESHFLTERLEVAPGSLIPSNGNVILPPNTAAGSGIFEAVNYRAPNNTEMPNVLVGASAGLATSGFSMLQKQMVAGDDWSAVVHGPDQAGYPSPDSGEDNIKMDRVLIGTDTDDPSRPLLIAVEIPGGIQQSPDNIATVYFSANAGWDEALQGSGRYALKLRGDGRAKLYEADRATIPTWTLRLTFRYTSQVTLAGTCHLIVVYKQLCIVTTHGANGNIVFRTSSHDGDSQKAVANYGHSHAFMHATGSDVIYPIPKLQATANPIIGCPLRMDIRRDFTSLWLLAQGTYRQTTYVLDDPFTLELAPRDTSVPFVLGWTSCARTGETVECKLYDAKTFLELPLLSTGINYKTYQPTITGSYFVQAILTTTLSGGVYKTSPLFKSYKCQREAVTTIISPGTSQYKVLRKVTITGAERDIEQSQATISIDNLANDATKLFTRASLCTGIQYRYSASDPISPNKVVKLFRGYANRTTATRRGRGTRKAGFGGNGPTVNFPHPLWKHLEVECVGAFQRLFENVTTVRMTLWDFSAGAPGVGLPLKVTDAIRAGLSWAGFPPSMIDIPDKDIRLFSGPEDNRAFIEPLVNIGQWIMGLIKDYLPDFLVFEPAAGTYGMWRLIEPSVSPYTNVAKFLTNTSSIGNKLPMYLPSYNDKTVGGWIPTAPIIAGTFSTYVKPPEANCIVVSTVGELSSSGTPQQLTQVLVNPLSYDFDLSNPTSDPTNPDYLGRCVKLFVMNPAIIGGASSTEAAILALNWTARRLYDISAHAIKMCTFQAPILDVAFIDPSDGITSKQRGLHYYDPILIDDQQFLIRNVNPAYEKDGIMVGIYQCEAPRF